MDGIDFESLKEGDTDPTSGKEIKFIVLVKKGILVYIDTNLEIQWTHSDDVKTDDDFGLVLNRVSYLESRARFITDKECLLSIKRQIAEGIARYLDFLSYKLSKEIHDIVEIEIEALNKKISWSWYFDAAYGLALICLVLWGMLWLLRDYISPNIGRVGFEVLLGGLIGAIGAIISIVSRGDAINLDANAGKTIHLTEGTARIIVGIAGASFVTLAFKGGVLLSGMKFSGSQLAVLLVLAIVAGASERLVPSLIGKVEKISLSK
ncbi:MAG: hypothetical protein PHQ60_10340 [Sideroxydans sp.]|nr:hypothetical protein [Sideroxydans sp.]